MNAKYAKAASRLIGPVLLSTETAVQCPVIEGLDRDMWHRITRYIRLMQLAYLMPQKQLEKYVHTN